MPRSVKRKPLWMQIQDVARGLHNYTISVVLHECLKRGVITQKMLAQWGNSAGELRVKAALKHEIAPGVPFSGVIAKTTQGEFLWTPVDAMSFEEYVAFLRHDQDNHGADIIAMKRRQDWGRHKFGRTHDVDAFEEFSPRWMDRYLLLADDEDR